MMDYGLMVVCVVLMVGWAWAMRVLARDDRAERERLASLQDPQDFEVEVDGEKFTVRQNRRCPSTGPGIELPVKIKNNTFHNFEGKTLSWVDKSDHAESKP